MKNITLTLLICLGTILGAIAQSGEVLYEEKMNMHRQLSGESLAYKDMIPEFRTQEKVLYFTENASVYKNAQLDQEDEEITGGGDGMQFKMKFSAPDEELYKNLESNERVEQKEFFGKKFLIKDAIQNYEWKMTGESRVIADQRAVQAKLVSDDEQNVVAWFTPSIQVPTGPDNFGMLPGLILEVNINDGETIMTALEVTMKEVDKEILKEPTKGKEVTQEEFEEIVKKKTEEMGATSSGGMIKVIKRN